MYPYCVETEKTPVKLYPLKDGRFQMIQEGKLGPFMSGYNYLLVETKLAEYLENLNVEGTILIGSQKVHEWLFAPRKAKNVVSAFLTNQ